MKWGATILCALLAAAMAASLKRSVLRQKRHLPIAPAAHQRPGPWGWSVALVGGGVAWYAERAPEPPPEFMTVSEWFIMKPQGGPVWWPRYQRGQNSAEGSAPLWLVIAPPALFAAALWRMDRPLPPAWRCGCGYDLRGLGADARCPECGRARKIEAQAAR